MVTLVVNQYLPETLGNYLTFICSVYLSLGSFLAYKWLTNWLVREVPVTKNSMVLVTGFMGYSLLRCGLLLMTAFTRHVLSIYLIIPTLLYLLVSSLLLAVWGRYCNQLRPVFDLEPRWYYKLFALIALFVAVAGIALTLVCELLPNQTSDAACINWDTSLDIVSCELTGLMLVLVARDLKQVFVLSGSYDLDLRTGGGARYVAESFFALRNLPWRIFNGMRLFGIYSLMRGVLLICYIFGGSAINEQMLAMVLFYSIEMVFLVISITILVGPPNTKDPRHERVIDTTAVNNAHSRIFAAHHSALTLHAVTPTARRNSIQ